MNRILRIAHREYLETVKTKAFLIGLFLTPVLVGVLMAFTSKMEKQVRGPRPARKIAVTNCAEPLTSDLQQAFEQYNTSNPQRQIVLEMQPLADGDPAAMRQRMIENVRRGASDGYLVIDKDILDGKAPSRYYTKTRSVADLELSDTIRRLLDGAVTNWRFRQHGLSPELIASLRRNVPFEQEDVTAETAQKRDPMAVLMVPFFFLFMMFVGVFGTNQQMLTSLVEEKSSRVIEVLLSAVSPFQLMTGKILGLAAVGLTLVGVWGSFAYATAVWRGMTGVISAANLAYFFIYFLLGFLLLSSILAAVGSVCNTIREAQSLMGPITILLVMPMVGWFYIAQHPQGTLAVALSFIPPITPMIMMLRIAAYPELSRLEIAATILLMLVSIPAVMWASAKIFRVGILMYGKPPKLRDLLHWLRYK